MSSGAGGMGESGREEPPFPAEGSFILEEARRHGLHAKAEALASDERTGLNHHEGHKGRVGETGGCGLSKWWGERGSSTVACEAGSSGLRRVRRGTCQVGLGTHRGMRWDRKSTKGLSDVGGPESWKNK